MRYRLISRSLQERLDEISGGDFTKQFDEVSRLFARDGRNPFARPRTVFFDLKHETPALLSIDVTHDMVEECEAYNPHDWNKFPDITPPEHVLMRIVLRNGRKECGMIRHFEDGAYWCDQYGGVLPKDINDNVVLFRNWNDYKRWI